MSEASAPMGGLPPRLDDNPWLSHGRVAEPANLEVLH